jgi:hypothetical protein
MITAHAVPQQRGARALDCLLLLNSSDCTARWTGRWRSGLDRVVGHRAGAILHRRALLPCITANGWCRASATAVSCISNTSAHETHPFSTRNGVQLWQRVCQTATHATDRNVVDRVRSLCGLRFDAVRTLAITLPNACSHADTGSHAVPCTKPGSRAGTKSSPDAFTRADLLADRDRARCCHTEGDR